MSQQQPEPQPSTSSGVPISANRPESPQYGGSEASEGGINSNFVRLPSNWDLQNKIVHTFADIFQGTDIKIKTFFLECLSVKTTSKNVVIFCNSVLNANLLTEELRANSIPVKCITQVDSPQKNKEGLDVLRKEFNNCSFIVTTDHLCEIDNTSEAHLVINFDVPPTSMAYRKRALFAIRMQITKSKRDKKSTPIILNLVDTYQLSLLKSITKELGINLKTCGDDE